jgi:EmrB/QacA subfamily drug resistance transporter
MATLDSSIVNIALPTLVKEWSSDLFQVKWVVVTYLLVITCLLLPFGRLSDQLGRKRVFISGYLIFVVGSILCGMAPSLMALVLFRAVQGVGASMLMVNGPAIITATFNAQERGAALGTLAMVVSAGLISGPSIGGFLITALGWRSIFMLNIPIGFFGIFLVYRFVRREFLVRESMPFDWAGAVIQVFLILALMVLFDPPHISFSGGPALRLSRWAMGIVALLFGLLFIKIESDARAPVFDLSLLKDRTFWSANLAGFLVSVAFSSVSVLMPFFLEVVMGFSPSQAGLFMTAIPLTIFVVAPISGRLSDRFGGQQLSFLGALVGALGLFLMAGVFGRGIHSEISHPDIVACLCLIGFSMGLFQSPNNNAIMTAVMPNKLGVASAFLATTRNLGLAIGAGLATGLFTWRNEMTGDFVGSLHSTHLVSGLIALGAVVASLSKQISSLWRS